MFIWFGKKYTKCTQIAQSTTAANMDSICWVIEGFSVNETSQGSKNGCIFLILIRHFFI